MQSGELRTSENAALICELLESGLTLRATALKIGCQPSAIIKWSKTDNKFSEQYALAREVGYLIEGDDIKDIADFCDDPAKAKVQIDARKWRLSKMLPKIYGDKIEHTGRIQHEIEITPEQRLKLAMAITIEAKQQ